MARQEDVIGRANVTDTPELLAYYAELEKVNSIGLWTVANDIEPWQPTPTSVPMIWRYEQMKPLVQKSVDMVTPEQAGRRVAALINPGRQDISACCGWLFSGLQTMAPGERASAHRHTASALRFIMEGAGAFTIVEGHQIDLGARDFVLTPNWTWHEHGVSEDGAWCIWQDGLDIPFTNAMESNFYEVHPDLHQQVAYPKNDSSHLYSNVGVQPVNYQWNNRYSPLLHYQWDRTYDALVQLQHAQDMCAFDGYMLRFACPLTGDHPMLTMGARMQRLPAKFTGKAHRHTGNVVYQVAKGAGYSVLNGTRFDWKERDIFCVPAWTWHEHVNTANGEDACLFQFNDYPVIEKCGFYRKQLLAENNGHQEINSIYT